MYVVIQGNNYLFTKNNVLFCTTDIQTIKKSGLFDNTKQAYNFIKKHKLDSLEEINKFGSITIKQVYFLELNQ